MMSLGYKAFESMGRQVKRGRTLDMRPWLNAKYPNAGPRIRSRLGIASRTRSQTQTRTRTQTGTGSFIPLGESGFIKKRRFRPLSFRRRRRFRRRLRSSYDKVILRGSCSNRILTPVVVNNILWYQNTQVADADAFLKGQITIPANNTSRLFFDKVGYNVEVYNPGSFNLNFRIIWGIVDETGAEALVNSFGTANPPQLNPYMGNHAYNTIWDSIRGTYSGKIPCGSRQKFNCWCNHGSRRLEDVEASRKAKFTLLHLLFWPDLVITSASTPAIAYPSGEAPLVTAQPFYWIGYPPSLNTAFLQPPQTAMTGIAAVTTAWITKQEDLTENQT